MTELEKKAIDVIRNHSHKLIDNFTQEDLENREISIFLAGYHEANKANEWHYPSKGELPKEDTAEKETLYLLWFGLNDSDYLTGVFSHGRFWCFDSGWFETNEVVAWKEIVLPELPKENE